MTDPESTPHIEAQSAVKAPAITLLVVGGLGAAGSLLGAVMNFAGFGMGAMSSEQAERIPSFLLGPIGGLINLVSLGVYALMTFGAYQMLTLKSYRLAMVAAIVGMIPCSCCCIVGLPVGVWAIVVLMKPAVKLGFESNRAQPA